MRRFIFGRRRGHKKHLVNMLFKFFKIKRPVIQRRRQSETILHKRCFPGTVARVHTAYLRNRHMRFIDDNQIIILKIIHQRKRRNARFQAVQMSGIILDSRTEPCLPQHLDIEIGTFRNPLRFQQFIFTFKISDPVFHFFFNVLTCRTNLLLWHNIMGCRKNSDMLQRRTHLSGQRVRLRDSVYLIPEKLNANLFMDSGSFSNFSSFLSITLEMLIKSLTAF